MAELYDANKIKNYGVFSVIKMEEFLLSSLQQDPVGIFHSVHSIAAISFLPIKNETLNLEI